MENSQKRFFIYFDFRYGKCDITVNNKAVNQGNSDGLQAPCIGRLSGQNSTVEILKQRNSRPEVLCKKGIVRNFVKFTGKHLCYALFFNKVAGLRSSTLLE